MDREEMLSMVRDITAAYGSIFEQQNRVSLVAAVVKGLLSGNHCAPVPSDVVKLAMPIVEALQARLRAH